MKYCTHCGKQVADDAVVCPSCGGGLSERSVGEEARAATGSAQTVPPVEDAYSGLSVAGLVFAFLFPLLGLILSIVAFKNAKRSGSRKSRRMSTAGIIIGSVLLALILAFALIYFGVIFILVAGLRNING